MWTHKCLAQHTDRGPKHTLVHDYRQSQPQILWANGPTLNNQTQGTDSISRTHTHTRDHRHHNVCTMHLTQMDHVFMNATIKRDHEECRHGEYDSCVCPSSNEVYKVNPACTTRRREAHPSKHHTEKQSAERGHHQTWTRSCPGVKDALAALDKSPPSCSCSAPSAPQPKKIGTHPNTTA